MEEKRPDGYLRVDMVGKTEENWTKSVRAKLIEKILSIMDGINQVDDAAGGRGKKAANLVFQHAIDRLKRPGLENEKIEAEVTSLYAKAERDLAEAKRINTEADDMECSLTMKKLRTVLKMSKVLLVGQEDEEAIIFSQQVDGILEYLEDQQKEALP